MIRGVLALSAVVLALLSAPAFADGPSDGHLAFRGGLSAGEATPTENMWFYEQYQRDYNDPNTQVHRNAESRGDQRRNRLASLKWFGFSNTRPRASSDPWHGDYSPHWTGNNSHYPNRWQGSGWPRVTVRTESSGVGTY
jgi:hypothetical protein